LTLAASTPGMEALRDLADQQCAAAKGKHVKPDSPWPVTDTDRPHTSRRTDASVGDVGLPPSANDQRGIVRLSAAPGLQDARGRSPPCPPHRATVCPAPASASASTRSALLSSSAMPRRALAEALWPGPSYA
jgi:hypothetical protein